MSTSSPSDFVELAATAAIFSSSTAPKTVARDIDGIPHLTRTLQQVSDTSQEVLRARARSVGPGTTAGANEVHAEAVRLLAGRGFAAERLRRAVAEINARPPFVARSAHHRVLSGDPAQFLALQRSAIASRAADEARLSANAVFRERFCRAVESDLSDARSSLIEALVARTDQRRVVEGSPDAIKRTPRAGQTPRTAPASRPAHTSRGMFTPRTPRTPRTPGAEFTMMMPEVDNHYLFAIRSVIFEGDAPSVASLVYETARLKGEHPHLLESFAIIAQAASFIQNDGNPAPHFRVHAARMVLEDQYAERTGVESLPVKPRQAAAGAVRAGVLEYVRSLAEQGKMAEIGERPHILDGCSLWAQVFYCFRVGNVKAALSVVNAAYDAGNADVGNYRMLMGRFVQAHESSPNSEFLTGSLVDIREYNMLMEEYRTKVWQSGDAYYRACYMLLARLELTPTMATPTEIHKSISESFTVPSYPLQSPRERISLPFPDEDFNSLFGSVEDYMWLRLFKCRSELEKHITTSLPKCNFVELQQIRKELVACGPSHFDPDGVQPFLYAFVLVCTGLYWDAVEFLTAQYDEQHIGGAAHLAMVLHLLQWLEPSHDYGKILWSYVSVFMRRQPVEAATYLLTIRDKEKVLHYLAQLVYETKEYHSLLGSSSDPTDAGALDDIVSRIPEAYSVVSRDDVDDLRRTIAKRVASLARDREDFHQAVEMFALAGDRRSSLLMLLQGIAVVVDTKSGPSRALALSQGRRTYARLQEAGETGTLVRSLHMLLAIASFFDEYHAGRLSEAWALLSAMQVLPLSSDTIVKRRADFLPASDRFDQSVRGCVGSLLRAALDIAEHALVTGNAIAEPSPSSAFHRPRVPENTRLPRRSQIKALVTFSGLMGLAETEVNARLVRIELLMA